VLRHYRNRVAIVTGAANGFGKALAKELAERGCHLALVDIDTPALLEVREELAAPGSVVTAHCADVGLEREVQTAAAAIEDAHGAAHLLINNAGISASASFKRTSAEQFEQVMRTNFFGAVHVCRAFLPLLEKHGQGQILNISSCFAWLGYPGKTAYASSKAALRAFSESLRLELTGSGVGVTVAYPGPLPTAIVRKGFCDREERRERENHFLANRGLPLTEVARRCLDKLVRNPSRIVIGLDYHLLDVLARVSPRLADRAMASVAARVGF
jgi:NAD(P)-dependent dehydrogenase (short-subunit alcohol dehydrogenase family)